MPYELNFYGIALFIEGLIFTAAASTLLYYAKNSPSSDEHNSKLKAGIFFIIFGVLSMIIAFIMWCVCGDIRHSRKRYEIEPLIA